jgi:hypothetical protein
MSLLNNDPLTQLAFSMFENKGVYAVLVGSGLSRAADIPTGWEITLDLIRRVALAKGVAEQADWAKWYRDETGNDPDYSALLAELAAMPEERRAILHGYIEPSQEDRDEGRKVPTTAHRVIAALVRGGYVRVLVTTNFDRLLENALREVGVEPTVVSSLDALLGAEPVVHSKCYVLKLHGDYKDARIRNIDEELSAYPAEYDALLDRIFDEHGLIVAGWSGEWDTALRGAMLRTANRRYPVWWLARSRVRTAAQELVDHRRARVVTASDADAFFSSLRQRIETLEQTRQQNPDSIELLVNSAKRYLAKSEFRIQLDELIAQEGKRLMALMDGEEFAVHGATDAAALRARIQRYEAITEGLVRVAGVLGRWGDGSELPVVLDLIRAIYAHAEKVQGGRTLYLGWRSYPALLVLYAYGLGLARAQRYKTLHALFTAQCARENREFQRMIEVLFVASWKGDNNDAWNIVAQTERSKTALSDYLLTRFTEWGSSFLGLHADFEMLFERFELLGSLAYLEADSEETLKTAMNNPAFQGAVRMPVGRIGWHSRNFERLIAELKAEDMRKKICDAGFAHGSSGYLNLFIDNATRIASQMSW